MKRAVVVFIEDKKVLLLQFLGLYESLKYIQASDTDLVVFGPQNALNKLPKDCIKIEYNPISYSAKWQNYHFINSISCLTDKNAEFLDNYDLILRSDVDTFLTPAWNFYIPDLYSAGGGGYVNDQNTRNKLKEIATKLGLRHKGFHNIGSTHYGNASLVRQVCKLSMEVTSYILDNEFKNGDGDWPGWYKGVALLYGCEIAMNHLVDEIRVSPDKLDFHSTSEESIKLHPHIHCWHTDKMFSKFHFYDGKYDSLSAENLDITKIYNYCLYMALNSKRKFFK
jgi:hypothetical protein